MNNTKQLEQQVKGIVANLWKAGLHGTHDWDKDAEEAILDLISQERTKVLELVEKELSVINGTDEMVPLDSVMYQIDKALSLIKEGKE